MSRAAPEPGRTYEARPLGRGREPRRRRVLFVTPAAAWEGAGSAKGGGVVGYEPVGAPGPTVRRCSLANFQAWLRS